MNPIPLATQQPFSYVVDVTLAASSNASYLLILGMDSEFDFYSITATSSLDIAASATALSTNNFNLLIRDVTSGRDYSTAPVQRNNLAGLVPINVQPEGRCIRFPRKQQLQFQFQNLVASSNVVQVVLHGYKIFQGSIL